MLQRQLPYVLTHCTHLAPMCRIPQFEWTTVECSVCAVHMPCSHAMVQHITRCWVSRRPQQLRMCAALSGVRHAPCTLMSTGTVGPDVCQSDNTTEALIKLNIGAAICHQHDMLKSTRTLHTPAQHSRNTAATYPHNIRCHQGFDPHGLCGPYNLLAGCACLCAWLLRWWLTAHMTTGQLHKESTIISCSQ